VTNAHKALKTHGIGMRLKTTIISETAIENQKDT